MSVIFGYFFGKKKGGGGGEGGAVGRDRTLIKTIIYTDSNI